jgi:hypothetical protein
MSYETLHTLRDGAAGALAPWEPGMGGSFDGLIADLFSILRSLEFKCINGGRISCTFGLIPRKLFLPLCLKCACAGACVYVCVMARTSHLRPVSVYLYPTHVINMMTALTSP